MIPTLFGITLLVFMLIALSPGGVGAGLQAGTGQMDSSNRAIKEAYLEDRYGLDDPVIVQYFRWLGRVLPIKFGVRDQINGSGEQVSVPKAIKDPPLWSWFVDELPEETELAVHEWLPEDDEVSKARYYRVREREYTQARNRLIAGKGQLNDQLGRAVDELKIKGVIDRNGKVRYDAFPDDEPITEASNWDEIESIGEQLVVDYEEAQKKRAELKAVFMAKPFPDAGFGVLPGVTIASPDMGVSFTKGRPVLHLIKEQLPVTLLLNLIATPIIYFIAVPCGLLAAVRSGGLFDKMSGALFIALWSFPLPLAGVLAVGYLANKEYMLGVFPVSGVHAANADTMTFLPTNGANGWEPGFILDTVWHVCLPVMCLVYGGFAVLSKQARAAMLDNFNMDYVRTAKAKGVSGRGVVFRHVFRNSLLPLITMFVTIFPAMLAGSVVVEKIFTINGMGSLTLDAIYLRDRELLLATTTMIAGVNLLALLLADILYAMADPRISYK